MWPKPICPCLMWEMCHRKAVVTTVGFQAHSTLDIHQGVSKYAHLFKESDFVATLERLMHFTLSLFTKGI